MTASVSLIIPFASEDIRRLQIFDWVEERWHEVCPGFEFVVGHDDPHDFNRSKARNRAFGESTGDIIVISDADTVCPMDNILNAIHRVEHCQDRHSDKSCFWEIAHTNYYSLTEEYTSWLLMQPPSMVLKTPGPGQYDWMMKARSTAGVLVMERRAYEAIGGYNEEFNGWGWEDTDFAVRMTKETGPPYRGGGPMLHLWHPRGLDFDQPFIDHNKALYERSVRGD